MIGSKIWERYLLKEIAKTVLFVAFAFYVLYVLVDYSFHSRSLSKLLTSVPQFLSYYFFHFAKRADIILPLALLLSSIRVLCTLNMQNELVALLAGGIKRSVLLRPFFLMAATCALLLYANYETFYPYAMTQLAHIQSKRASTRQMDIRSFLHVIRLDDNSHLIYQTYDPVEKNIFDALWIRSADEIYRMKYLYPLEKMPRGLYIDHLMRNENGEMVVVESTQEATFSKMLFDRQSLSNSLSPAENLSFSNLWAQFPLHNRALTDRDAEVHTHFYLKLGFPLLCFLVILGPTPFCLRFGRDLPVFLIYTGSLFGFVTFLMLMDSATILGEHHVLSPAFVIFTPIFFLFALLGWRFRYVEEI